MRQGCAVLVADLGGRAGQPYNDPAVLPLAAIGSGKHRGAEGRGG
jgi:hypothetical protein